MFLPKKITRDRAGIAAKDQTSLDLLARNLNMRTTQIKIHDEIMSQTKHDHNSESATPPVEEVAAAPASDTQQPVDPVAVLEAERDDLKDKLLRVLAEMENLRRRNAKELADARMYSTTNFAKDMLTVADNIRRALEAAPREVIDAADSAFKGVVDGVELTERDLHNTLERHGVKKLDPLNQKFDPHFHQAMFEVPDASVATGTVVQVVQTGYAIGDRVLRPAMVGVAKGGPKPSAPVEGEESGSAGAR